MIVGSFLIVKCDLPAVVLNSPLEYNGGSITDLAGNALSSNAFAAPNTSLINVNDGEPQFEWYDSTPALVGTYDYGDPNANTSETFTVRNIGTAPTKASFQINVNNNDGAVFVIATDNCTGNLIAINDTCAVTIDYNDIGAPGLKTGDATADDPGFTVNPGYTLNLEGTR